METPFATPVPFPKLELLEFEEEFKEIIISWMKTELELKLALEVESEDPDEEPVSLQLEHPPSLLN